MTPRVNVEVFSPSRGIHSSFVKRSSNIEPFNTSVDGYPDQERNLTSFCTDKIIVKSLPGKIVTDLDPIKRMNFASSSLRKITKLIDFGLSIFNAKNKPNSVFVPSNQSGELERYGIRNIERQLARF